MQEQKELYTPTEALIKSSGNKLGLRNKDGYQAIIKLENMPKPGLLDEFADLDIKIEGNFVTPALEDMQKRCSEFAQNLTDKNKKQLAEKMSELYNYNYDQAVKLPLQYHSLVWTGHTIAVLISEDRAYICNRGDPIDRGSMIPGIQLIEGKGNIAQLKEFIANATMDSIDTKIKEIDKQEFAVLIKKIGQPPQYIEHKGQLAGNCTVASPKLAFKAFLIEKTLEQMSLQDSVPITFSNLEENMQNKIKQEADLFYKEFTLHLRKSAIKDLIDFDAKLPDNAPEKVILPHILMLLAATKTDKFSKIIEGQEEKIIKYLLERDNSIKNDIKTEQQELLLNPNIIKLILSNDFSHIQEAGKFKYSDLLESADKRTLNLLFSKQAIEAYLKSPVTFADLKKVTNRINGSNDSQIKELLEILLSDSAIVCYGIKALDFSSLVDIKDIDKIKILTSEGAKSTYVLEGIIGADLIKIINENPDYQEKINSLTSPDAISAYEKNNLKASDLISIINEQDYQKKINVLLSVHQILSETCTVSDLIKVMNQYQDYEERIARLISYNAQKLYTNKEYTESPKLLDLATISDLNRIDKLTSATELYEKGIAFSELNKIEDTRTIELLISSAKYLKGKLTFLDLKDLVFKSKDENEVLINILEWYSTEKLDAEKIVSITDYYDIDKLLSDDAIKAYSAGIKPSDLINAALDKGIYYELLSPLSLKILGSGLDIEILVDILSSLKQEGISMNDDEYEYKLSIGILEKFNSQNQEQYEYPTEDESNKMLQYHQILMEDNKIKAYKLGLTPLDLIKLDNENSYNDIDLFKAKAEILTSDNTILGVQNKFFTYADLKSKNIDKIKLFTSDNAMSLYNENKDNSEINI